MNYNFVLFVMFDEVTSLKIIEIKNFLKLNNIQTTEKAWPPHITIDLYENISEEEIKTLTAQAVKDFKPFNFDFFQSNTFGERVLFLEPNNKKEFENIKNKFDQVFKDYKVNEIVEMNRKYSPHATLAISDDFTQGKELLDSTFKPIKATATKVAIYKKDMTLVKEFDLSKNNNLTII